MTKRAYGDNEPRAQISRKGRYIGVHYPNWEKNGQPCNVVQEQGVGFYIEFEPGGNQFLVHRQDVEATG